MKCQKCNTENKDFAKNCKKCGSPLVIVPVWRPTWKWHLKTLGIIYVVLVILFFAVNALFKPYLRKLPQDVTPWLKHTQQAK